MVSAEEAERQLKKLGYNFHYWGRNEIKELRQALTVGENIKYCVNGHYLGGFAMLVATDLRLLLIDRKPMYLTIEAIWYDKIGQVDFNHRLLNATICISTPNKELNFTTWNNVHLQQLLVYTQEKMAESKHLEQNHGQFEIGNELSGAMREPAVSSVNTESLEPTQPQPQQHIHLPKMPAVPSPYEVTLYAATRLPYSRHRYYDSGRAASA